ncbi:SusD/RagB family nutrient-binding outer membrane lipoprotein [Nemorincola caseinilytica]|uniref:SusD/RagB family nutrient-binding outer membrane lipoprotein n=1 Tax=Nemorincola caseinilytica TaxID=2054315 RepID=A0ABP8ND71_9BACT
MSINKKIVVTAMAGLTLGVSSCRKYLDVNNNPNVASNATVNTLLPAAQLYIGSAMGTDMQINGAIWAQHWTQSPAGKEYVALEQHTPNAEAYNMSWQNLYAGAENFHQLYKLADAQYKGQYKAIAMLMQAYAFQALADGWGDIPYSDALKGQYPDGHIVNPKYDSQRVVYRGIVATIDSATKLINTADASAPGADDLVYGGNMSKWNKFANTLKLRALLRVANIDPVYAKNKIDSLFMKNPQFIGNGDDARIVYGAAKGNNHPLFAELSAPALGGKQQLAGSKTAIDTMNANNDLRGMVVYRQVSGMGLVGVTQSAYDIALPDGSYSIPSSYVGADISSASSATASVMLLSSWESYFLQAEAFARGYAVGNDQQMFHAGINASFLYYSNALTNETGIGGAAAYTAYVGSLPAAYWTLYPTTGTTEDRLRYIITQKWLAMSGTQGFEAWTEWRRTGYPDFLVSPRNSHLGGKMPLRFLYPASEKANNSNYPGEISVTTPLWWDAL